MADHRFMDRVNIRRWREIGLITHEEAAQALTANQTGDPEQVTEPGSSGELEQSITHYMQHLSGELAQPQEEEPKLWHTIYDPAPDPPEEDKVYILTAEDYSELAGYTRGVGSFEENLACCGLGLAGEAGEVADLIKKELFHKHDPQPDKVKEEMGDLLWYAAWTAELYGFTLTEAMEANIAKLQKRYPEGFSTERSRNRTI